MPRPRARLAAALVACAALLSTGCDDTQEAGDAQDEGHGHPELPEEFRDLENPLADSAEAAEAGGQIYAMYCQNCHGATGGGDGPIARSYDPPPSALDTEHAQAHPDGYLFWRITKGGLGEPFDSAMPAFAGILDETERWQLVTFLRTL